MDKIKKLLLLLLPIILISIFVIYLYFFRKEWIWQSVECYFDWADIFSSSLKSWVVLYEEWDWLVVSWTCVDFEQITTEQWPWVSNVRMEEIWTRRCEDTKLKMNCNRLEPIWKYKDMVKNAKLRYWIE